jgi:hypothetical protein
MSIRFIRSPLAPKKMMLQGSWIRFESIPARSGFGRARAAAAGRAKVAAELSDIDRAPAVGGRDAAENRKLHHHWFASLEPGLVAARSAACAVTIAPPRVIPIVSRCTHTLVRRVASLGAPNAVGSPAEGSRMNFGRC